MELCPYTGIRAQSAGQRYAIITPARCQLEVGFFNMSAFTQRLGQLLHRDSRQKRNPGESGHRGWDCCVVAVRAGQRRATAPCHIPSPAILQALFSNGLEAPLMIVVTSIIISLSYPLPRRVDRWTRWEPTFCAWNLSSVRSELSPRPRPCTVPYRTLPHRTVREVWTA